MRLAAAVEYDGTCYNGWQSQPDGKTVQDEVQRALAAVANHPVAVVCAGRTDAGVHAVSQIIHFDTPAKRTARSWLLGTNSALPGDISIRWVQQVPEEFHARFSAQQRRYRYVILNRTFRSALLRHRVCFEPRPLNAAAMNSAARYLTGQHDFNALRAASCQAKTSVRTIHSLSVSRDQECVVIDISANAFLHNMVRIIAGVLLRVGRGDAKESWVQEILAAGDRRHLGVTAPASGLYFTGVVYPDSFAFPDCPGQTNCGTPFLF